MVARIELTPPQILMAANSGVFRTVQMLQNGNVYSHNAPLAGCWERGINGVVGEVAGAIWANRCWKVPRMNERDVGDLFDVRAVDQSHKRLWLYPEDADAVPFVLAQCDLPYCDLVGWIFAAEGKLPEFWEDRGNGRPAFYVPRDVLRPMSELQTWLDRQP